MTRSAPTYDLMLLLDPEADESARAKIVSESRAAIEGQAELLRHDDWGERPLSYPIRRRTSAEYHLLQFTAATPELLGGLEHSLHIADGILRFRIIKLRPGVPEAPDMRAPAGARRGEAEAPAEQPPEGAEPAEASVAEGS